MRDEDDMNRYRVAYAAEDTDAWQPGRVVAVEQGETDALVSIEVEASREFVALKRAYRSPGQRAQVRFGGGGDGTEEVLTIASPPLSLSGSRGQLWRLKGDIYAGQTKKEAVTESLKLNVDVLRPASAAEVQPGDEVEIGPFTDEGIDLRPVIARFQAPMVFIFCDGSLEAVCNLRAALEAEDCAAELRLQERTATLLFCGPSPSLPPSLAAWLAAVQKRFNLALAELGTDPKENWSEAAVPAVRRVAELGQRLGAIVLGSPEFVAEMSGRLSDEGVDLIASSGSVHPLARVVEPEQI